MPQSYKSVPPEKLEDMNTLGARNRFLGLEGGGGDKSPLPLLDETVTLEMFRLETPRLLNTSCHTIPLPFLLLTL